ncbi:MAG: hypothetical protein PHR69_06595 [Sphaerochaeta sp.]|nr:hypothetical protein [Sphaerochaeta sp.]
MSFILPEYHAPDFSLNQFRQSPDVSLQRASRDGVAPLGFHSTSMFPEYFKVGGTWLLAEESRMDCLVVLDDSGRLQVVEGRRIRKGDRVVVGRTERGEEGIYVHATGFLPPEESHDDKFVFRTGRSRETAFSRDYDKLYELLEYEKEHGNIVFVLGPAVAFDNDSRRAMQLLIENGYVDGILAGNALATHDLEAGYFKTALGQNIYTQESMPNGHYNHLDVLNMVREYGSIETFIEKKNIKDGIVYAMMKQKKSLVLGGSIRDDGPMPEVYANVYEAQDAMRAVIRKATTVISLATQLHSIATGNMTPSFRVVDKKVRPVFIYSVDISEFAVNKLKDRGSLSATGIVTNVQDFIVNVAKGLHVGKI